MGSVAGRCLLLLAIGAVGIYPARPEAGDRKDRRASEREATQEAREAEKEYRKAVRESEREYRKAAEEDEREYRKAVEEDEREYGKDVRERERDRWKEAREAERERREQRGGHVIFSRREVETIVDFFRHPPAHLPPGLAKRGGDLPPGIEKQIRRGGSLPPGLKDRIEPLPPDLDRQLRPLSGGARRGRIGRRVLVYDPKTAAILDAVTIASRALGR